MNGFTIGEKVTTPHGWAIVQGQVLLHGQLLVLVQQLPKDLQNDDELAQGYVQLEAYQEQFIGKLPQAKR